jgi:putative ABC transport system substrate-binding protein
MSLHGPMASVCSDAATRPELNVAHSDFFQREPLVDPVSPVVISCFDGQSKANIGVKTRGRTMRRRDFVKAIGGAAASWSLPARAQERMRRIGVLMNIAADDQEAQLYMAAFQQGLQELGWTVGRNLRLDHRWGPSSQERTRQQVAELLALSPDVVLATGGAPLDALQRASRTVPVVFPQSIDPVGQGNVASLARPGGNITGFAQFEYSLSGKWLQLLKEIAPGVARVGVLRNNPPGAAGIGQWAVIQAFAELIGVECTPLGFSDANEIERGIAAFERDGSGGLIVQLNALATAHRQTIIASAARHRLPAMYPFRYFAADGGLISYGADLTIQYRRAAGYVDRILKGEKPADLPVQKPTKYDLTINLKTAKALGLDIPATVLARADEVIE